MNVKKLVRKLNSYLRQARKFRTPLILIMGVAVFAVFRSPQFADSEALRKLEGQAIDQRFLSRMRDQQFLAGREDERDARKEMEAQGKKDTQPKGALQRMGETIADLREKYFTFGSLEEFGQHPKVELVGITTQSLDQGLLGKLLEDQLKWEDEQEQKSAKASAPPAPKADAPAAKADAPAAKADAPAAKADAPAPKADAPAPKADSPAPEKPEEAPKTQDVKPASQPDAAVANDSAPSSNSTVVVGQANPVQTTVVAGGQPAEAPAEAAPARRYSDALKLMGKGKWPLPRAVYSYALERLFEMGAKTIVIDILYVSSQTSMDPRINAALDRIDEAKQEIAISDDLIGELEQVLGDEGELTPAITLGLQRLNAAKSKLKLTDQQMTRINAILAKEGRRILEGDEPFAETLARHKGKVVLAFSNNKTFDDNGKARIEFLRPNTVLTEALGADGMGYAFFQPDPDGVVRRVESFTSQFKESNMASFQTGPDDWMRFSPLAVTKYTGKPVPPRLEVINYRGAAGTFEVMPIEELFSDRILKGDPRYVGGKRFENKMVYLGPISETFHDEHRTPLGTQPGVEIHAHYGAALLDEKPITEFPKQKELWLIVGAILVAAVLLWTFERVFLRLGIGVAVVIAYVIGAQYMFANHHILVPMVAPFLAIMAVGGVITMFDFAVEQLEKAHVRGVLDKYVSSNVASMVINQGDSFDQALRGQTKPVSVLFSDVRGFTTLSESRPPEVLVAQLNEYFLKMVDEVLAHGGTLQKFIGDAIMAVWGDTHSLGVDKDCLSAVRSALKMRASLDALNKGWEPLSRDEREILHIGIGINHGTVVVGELGHPQRMEFTCLGDGVNLSARLESATKQFGVDILVAEEAEKLTREQIVYRRVDMAVFKGKTQPIHVFTPLGEVGMDIPAWLGHYHEALDKFHARKFAEAKEAFDKVNEEMGGGDYLCKMYHKRCEHYLGNPPPEDWDGSWVLSEK